ncbi:hypothetical protein AC249_AIPGENE15268 [Exaiptasia diaphana]|nr:hypothetical protein AC249_AIPGENE15268 [Exaiptasia diaphana]
MRWHPLVIKWCLRLYSKSHSAYEDLRESGFLKLPSGRTLSDYKNFASPMSGWQTTRLQNMKESFQKSKIGKHGKLGGLFFDEVKIKEGLVSNPSTFELIGFTDLDDDDVSLEVTEKDVKLEKKIATHVLQFFYKSLFANFEFPCAFFLTRGVTATKLNRVFWQVNTLSTKVIQEMATYENNGTASTQEYIKNCEKFWNVFNDNKPLESHNDARMTSLTEVLTYFKNWKAELQQLYKAKAEISSHFITWQTMFDLEVSIDGLKELLTYIQSVEFQNSYGQLYIIPKRLNQDIVESFFSSQRQMCGGSTNMTAFTYGYNVNGLISYRQSRLLRNKQTNVYEVEECYRLAQASELLPKKKRPKS